MKRVRDKIYIYGKHALEEALVSNPNLIKKVYLSGEVLNDKKLLAELREHKIIIEHTDYKRASKIVGRDTSHQGVIAVINPNDLMVDFEDFMRDTEITDNTMLILLDELTDPQNVGAIIRSAAAFGAAGVLIPKHNQAPITGAVAKASAGMVFRVPVVSIGNINYTVDKLKDAGFWVYGLDISGNKEPSEEEYTKPTLFIVGNEAEGIRMKTLERCDMKLRIKMHKRCESLNASTSTAVVLYAWSLQHKKALK